VDNRSNAAESGAGNSEAGEVRSVLICRREENDARSKKCAERGKAKVAENRQDASDKEKRDSCQETAD